MASLLPTFGKFYILYLRPFSFEPCASAPLAPPLLRAWMRPAELGSWAEGVVPSPLGQADLGSRVCPKA